MKILTVAIPNHHFFQWVNQLKDSGHEVFWFDITDGGPKSDKISWATQIKGWKLIWDFPFRQTIKKHLPICYKIIQRNNERNVSDVFTKQIEFIKPDVIHCFEMQLSGLPILEVLECNKNIPLIYSSWGSDMFYHEEMGVSKTEMSRFLLRSNYLITDCNRDHTLALRNGFKGDFLGVFPGNGGISLINKNILPTNNRKTILIKGYNDGVGKALVVLKALEQISDEFLTDKDIIVYSADNTIKPIINNSKKLSELIVKVYSRYHFLPNEDLLSLMGKSCIHVANSVSDGMPNVLLEAIGMGAFPIQSNPGNVTEEVITHGKNGFLITNPLDKIEIANHIINALQNEELRQKAQDFNVNFIKNNYNRNKLKPKIIALYEQVKK